MTDDELSILIDEIETHKGIVRSEYEDMREAYNAGRQRSVGYTKTELNLHIARLHGEIMGHEYALTHLYRRVTNMKEETDG